LGDRLETQRILARSASAVPVRAIAKRGSATIGATGSPLHMRLTGSEIKAAGELRQ